MRTLNLVIEKHMNLYNKRRLPSAIGYKTSNKDDLYLKHNFLWNCYYKLDTIIYITTNYAAVQMFFHNRL